MIDRANPRCFNEMYLQVSQAGRHGQGGASGGREGARRTIDRLRPPIRDRHTFPLTSVLSFPMQAFSVLYNSDLLARDRIVALL